MSLYKFVNYLYNVLLFKINHGCREHFSNKQKYKDILFHFVNEIKIMVNILYFSTMSIESSNKIIMD